MKNKKLMILLGVVALAGALFVGYGVVSQPTTEETTQEGTAEEGTTEEGTTEEGTTEEGTTEEETTEEGTAEAATWVDGTYRIEYEAADEAGYKTFLEVTIAEGAVSTVTFDEANDAGEMNEEDQADDDALETALMTATTPEEFEQMIEGLAEGDAFKELVTKLAEQMVAGNTETLVITE